MRWELFDLAKDPAEKSEGAARYLKKLELYRPRLEAWLASVARSFNAADY